MNQPDCPTCGHTVKDGRWLTIREVAAWTGFAVQTLRRWHSEGQGPECTNVGGRALRYWEADVAAFMTKAKAAA